MRTTLVYDLPTRLFHWLFSGLFLMSFVIAKTVDDESLVFSYHMISGLLLGGLVLWRIFWGVFGSQHARFTGFSLNPLDLKDYFLGILSGSKKRWPGHNPAASWAAVTMFSLAFWLAVTGYLMSTGYKEAFEDVHEFMANSFIIVAVLHIAGVVFHSIRHKDSIALSMIDGKKELSDSSGSSIPSSRRFAAVLLLALVTSSGVYLVKNFDSQNKTLTVFGQTLQLGENEDNESGSETMTGESTQSGKNDDDDDDDGDDDGDGDDD